MRSRILDWQKPAVFPGLTLEESRDVWDRAELLGMVVDQENELTEGERMAIGETLEAQPRLGALAAAYHAALVYATLHPVLSMVAAVLLPAFLLRVTYLAFRALLG